METSASLHHPTPAAPHKAQNTDSLLASSQHPLIQKALTWPRSSESEHAAQRVSRRGAGGPISVTLQPVHKEPVESSIMQLAAACLPVMPRQSWIAKKKHAVQIPRASANILGSFSTGNAGLMLTD